MVARIRDGKPKRFLSNPSDVECACAVHVEVVADRHVSPEDKSLGLTLSAPPLK